MAKLHSVSPREITSPFNLEITSPFNRKIISVSHSKACNNLYIYYTHYNTRYTLSMSIVLVNAF